MLVVADTSPFIILIAIDLIEIVPSLYKQVCIPPQVFAELSRSQRPEKIRNFFAQTPGWLIQRSPSHIETILRLHEGESAAISLAREIHAYLLLIDEIRRRRAATARHIPITGTVGVLELAAHAKLLNLADAFERLKKTDFRISNALLDARLKSFLAKGTP